MADVEKSYASNLAPALPPTSRRRLLPPYRLGGRFSEQVDCNLILFVTTLVNFLDLFQLSSALFSLPMIQESLHFTSQDVNWVLVVYSITFAALLLVGGQLGQYAGLEKTFIAGTFILTVSNVVNTSAQNKAALLVGRALSGVGAGITAPNGLAIIGRIFPDGPRRNKALAVYGACAPLGSTVGSIVGALLASSPAGWRSIFWVSLILTGLSFVLACLFLPRFATFDEVSIDVKGALVFTVAIALLVYGVNDGERAGWTSASVLVGVILGALACLLFVFVELKVKQPAVPRYVWTSAPLGLMLFAVLAFGGGFSAWFFIATQLAVNLLGYTPVLTAVYLLPAGFSAMIGGGLSAPLVKFIGEKGTLLVGLAITAAGAVAWVFATPDRAGGTGKDGGYWYFIVSAIIFVCSSPLAVVPAQSIMLRHVEAGSHAVTAALFNTAYQVGASILLAGSNALMNSQRETNEHGVSAVTMKGYQNAFWLLAGVIGAGGVLVATCYWPNTAEEVREGAADRAREEEANGLPTHLPCHQSDSSSATKLQPRHEQPTRTEG